ncbi:MAG: hypothetical protein JHD35_02170 [Sphingopyxis sp.]|nr:hypothetical protein [Sphingopyxis sp.]
MALANIDLPPRQEPLILAWPVAGNPLAFVQFDDPDQWRRFIDALGIHPLIPDIVAAKFARAQTLYLLGWIDPGLVKAGELAALVTLELALTDRLGGAVRDLKRTNSVGKSAQARRVAERKPSFAELLRHLVDVEKLTDVDIPVIVRCGGTAIGQLVGDVRPTLAERRNSLAHGDPFDGLPAAGLLELVRDLINFAYRDYIAEGERQGISR